MPPKKIELIPLEKIFELHFVDANGRVFVLDHGNVRGQYILREMPKQEKTNDKPAEI